LAYKANVKALVARAGACLKMDQFHYHVSSEPRSVASGPFIRPLRFSVVGDPRLLPNAVDRKYDPMCDETVSPRSPSNTKPIARIVFSALFIVQISFIKGA
jgi:hypothetical protein